MHKFLFYNVEEYNKLIIKQEFVHEVGQLLRKYCTGWADTDTSSLLKHHDTIPQLRRSKLSPTSG